MNAEWIMVVITGIYVIATIFICWANFKSASASKEQLKEMQKQYAETNRPLIELEFHYSRRTWYIARFVNHGNLTAQRVRINLDQSFIDSLPEDSFRNELERIKGKECIIGVGQHYDLFIGSNKMRGNPNMMPLTGTIIYEAQGKEYKSDLFVDLEHYMTFFSSTTDEEDFLKSVNKISDQLKGIRQALNVHKDEILDSTPDDNDT
ncbi:MAG: hypothetical protein IK026_07105 [Eubacteriaceae bacterium]|nr:hypothetical protein [Eubacteriaceae bacterium]